MNTYLSIYLSICQSIHLWICIFIHLSNLSQMYMPSCIAGWLWQLVKSFMKEELKLAMNILFEV